MNRAEYAPTAPPGYATVGSELTETDNEPPFRVFKFLTPKKFPPDFPFFRGERTLPPLPPGYATDMTYILEALYPYKQFGNF